MEDQPCSEKMSSDPEPVSSGHAVSALLNLPSEIRLKIYEYVFGDAELHLDPTGWVDHHETRSEILQVCKLIHKEAEPLYGLKLKAYTNDFLEEGDFNDLPNRLRKTTRSLVVWNDDIRSLSDPAGTHCAKSIFPNLKDLTIICSCDTIRDSTPFLLPYEAGKTAARYSQDVKDGMYDSTLLLQAKNRIDVATRNYCAAQNNMGIQVFCRLDNMCCTAMGQPDVRLGFMRVTYDFGKKKVLERHWRGKGAFSLKQECLTKGTCSLCE